MKPDLYICEHGTDIGVEIVEYLDPERVRVRAKIGTPFCRDSQFRFLQCCTESDKVVNASEVEIIQYE